MRARPLHAAFLATVLAVAAAPRASAAAAPELRPVAFESLRGKLESSGRVAVTERGLEVDVDGPTTLALPFAAQELELDVEANGPVLATWANRSGDRFKVAGPPWRHALVPRARGTLRLDLRIADGWTVSSQPVLVFTGSGAVTVHAMRARPVPSDPEEVRRAFDRARFWAPESVGNTTINTLTPSFWSASRRTWLADVVAGAALLAFACVLGAVRLRRGRLRPGVALAAAGALALAAWDAHFLVRFLPMARLSFDPDPEARIRTNHVSPELGALAALARATLRPDERVGTIAAANDWFSPQALCFNLAPRRCAIVKRGEQEHAGISGVGRLRLDEMDAIVAIGAGPLPDGFVPVAAVSRRAVVARRP